MKCSSWSCAFFCAIAAAAYAALLRLVTPTYTVHAPPAAVVITGTSSGLGRNVTFHMASLGFTVFAGVRKDADAKKLRDDAVGFGVADLIKPLVLDVSKPATITAAVDAVREWQDASNRSGHRGKHLFGIVNNAGIGYGHTIGNANLEEVQKSFDVNVFGPQRMVEAFLPLLKKTPGGGGRIVNVGSIAGRVTIPNFYPYQGTKFAVEAYTRSLRMDLDFLQETGISVSILEPGPMASAMCDRPEVCRGNHQEVNAAFEDALLAAQPKTRYEVADVLGIPSWLLGIAGNLTPDRIMEYVVRFSFFAPLSVH